MSWPLENTWFDDEVGEEEATVAIEKMRTFRPPADAVFNTAHPVHPPYHAGEDYDFMEMTVRKAWASASAGVYVEYILYGEDGEDGWSLIVARGKDEYVYVANMGCHPDVTICSEGGEFHFLNSDGSTDVKLVFDGVNGEENGRSVADLCNRALDHAEEFLRDPIH